MRASEIRDMSDADIRARIAELEEERFRLRFRSATETLEDPLRLRAVRKDVARLRTVLRERTLAGASGPAAPKGKAAAKAATKQKTTAPAKRAAKTAARR